MEKYQGLKRPEGRTRPTMPRKIHIVVAPAYYHNYMMGQLFACQVHRTIAREVLKSDNWPSGLSTPTTPPSAVSCASESSPPAAA